MTSDVFGHFWPTYLPPTYLVLPYNVRFWGLCWTPLPNLISDVINGRSPRQDLLAKYVMPQQILQYQQWVLHYSYCAISGWLFSSTLVTWTLWTVGEMSLLLPFPSLQAPQYSTKAVTFEGLCRFVPNLTCAATIATAAPWARATNNVKKPQSQMCESWFKIFVKQDRSILCFSHTFDSEVFYCTK